MNLKQKAKEIKKNLTAIFIAFKKSETPWYAKIIMGITIGYALSPIDIIPDFIPVLGYLDDLIILPLLIILSVKLIPREIMEESLAEAENTQKNDLLKKWYFGLPIIFIWVFIIIFIIMKFV